MNYYLPEGMGLRRGGFTPELLRKAKAEGTILQAPAVLCDEKHDLLVDLGCCTGHLPREECAIGILEGETRDIAILSRVGKAVSFRVVDFLPNGTPLLSRRLAQEEARNFLFENRRPGDILPAVVTSLASFGAFCDVGCGLPALLGIEHISVSRISHSRDRFREDQPIFAVVRSMDPDSLRIQLSHKELLGTWAENAACFSPGETVVGIVRSVEEYGVFIEIAPNLAGLAESCGDLIPGQAVSVYIKNILPDKMKIKLVVVNRELNRTLRFEPRYFITKGRLERWVYSTPQCRKHIETHFG